jgi:multidrug efflux system outer membrane protein
MMCKNETASSRKIYPACLALTTILYLGALTGCLVGPDYQPPQMQVPAAWTGPTSAQPTPVEIQDLVHWWTTFNDSVLTSLVNRAASSNLDLKLAEARIRQSRAARGIAVAGLGPTVTASGDLVRSRTAITTGNRTQGNISNLYQTGLDSAWELDIFGGTRRNIEAADADLLATVEDRRDVLVTLTAEVALNYIDLRAIQQRIDIARKNLKAQEHTADLTHQRFEAGFVGRLDVANADAQVATTASTIPLLESSARQAIYNLGILLGQDPAALLEELTPAAAIPATPPEVPAGLPTDMLRRRPDIRRAEAQIHSATARIGVATADLFPKFALSGAVGFRSNQFSSWVDWVNRFWSVGPSASWQVFTSGAVRSNIKYQEALQEQSVIAYQQTVLTALQDVENALIASAKEADHLKALAEAVAANRQAVELSTQLYTQGQIDFLNVLNAQRSLFVSEDALVQSTGNVSTNLVALYKALGGGWNN